MTLVHRQTAALLPQIPAPNIKSCSQLVSQCVCIPSTICKYAISTDVDDFHGAPAVYPSQESGQRRPGLNFKANTAMDVSLKGVDMTKLPVGYSCLTDNISLLHGYVWYTSTAPTPLASLPCLYHPHPVVLLTKIHPTLAAASGIFDHYRFMSWLLNSCALCAILLAVFI